MSVLDSRILARITVAMTFGLALGLGSLGRASAHASYVHSDPAANAQLDAAPTSLHVWFVEAPDPARSSLTLFDAKRQPVVGAAATPEPGDNTELSVPLSLPGPGVYTVFWQTVSAVDGDAAHGYFAFSVGPL